MTTYNKTPGLLFRLWLLSFLMVWLSGGGMLEAAEWLETWDSAPLGEYAPDADDVQEIPDRLEDLYFLVPADTGYWYVADTGVECGDSTNRAEIIPWGSGRALKLTSRDQGGCANNIWVDLDDAFHSLDPRFPRVDIPVSPDTQISFYEEGYLLDPEPRNSEVWIPNGDTVFVAVFFRTSHVLAYVLQRHPDNEIRNEEFYIKEVQLPTGGGRYVRNLHEDFTRLFGHAPESNISAVQFEVSTGSATGWALLDDLRIGDGSAPATPAEDPQVLAFFPGCEYTASGHYTADWLGRLTTASFPWVYHVEFGWWHCGSSSSSGFWVYQPGKGWLWTSKEIFPILYNANTATWIIR
ncbi:MAG: hypothetical protein ACP5I4_16395 [Oceanipulchritudo sp.]